MMRSKISTIIILAILFLSPFSSYGQFGLSVKYNQQGVSKWNDILEGSFNKALLDSGYEIGFDYWLRLKNYRVEFYPEVYYATSKSDLMHVLGQAYSVKANELGFNANVNFYLFDLLGDCDCPTFSKDGNFFTKGFFVQLSPGVSYFDFEQSFNTNGKQNGTFFSYKIGLGIGIDFGITNLLTLTPFVKYHIHPSVTWEGFGAFHSINGDIVPDDSRITKTQFGIRLGFRPDYRPNRF